MKLLAGKRGSGKSLASLLGNEERGLKRSDRSAFRAGGQASLLGNEERGLKRGVIGGEVTRLLLASLLGNEERGLKRREAHAGFSGPFRHRSSATRSVD